MINKEQLVDTSKISLRRINKSVAKDMIVKNHYSHKWSLCKYAIGIYYLEDDDWFIGPIDKLIGVLVYGHPVGAQTLKSIIPTLKTNEVLELTRLFIYDNYGKNIESYTISRSFKWLRKNAPDIKMLISYADPEQNHLGIIYQATNWLYQGCGDMKLMPNYSVRVLEGDKWMHSRTVGTKYGSTNLEHLKKMIGHDFWIKEDADKHRYIQFLVGKKERNKLMKQLKHPVKPYPKEHKHIDNIKKIIVEQKNKFEY